MRGQGRKGEERKQKKGVGRQGGQVIRRDEKTEGKNETEERRRNKIQKRGCKEIEGIKIGKRMKEQFRRKKVWSEKRKKNT